MKKVFFFILFFLYCLNTSMHRVSVYIMLLLLLLNPCVVLRQARRDRQLVSKRLLLNEEEQEKELMETNCTPLSQDQVTASLHITSPLQVRNMNPAQI